MLNEIVVQGRITKDIETKTTSTQKTVANFNIACERDYRPTGDPPETDFLNIVAWGKTAEFVEKHFSKGDMIIVSGRLQIRTWNDKDGNRRSNAEILAENVHFAGGKKKKETAPKAEENYQERIEDTSEYRYHELNGDKELPF